MITEVKLENRSEITIYKRTKSKISFLLISHILQWHTKRPEDRQKTLEIRNQSIVE